MSEVVEVFERRLPPRVWLAGIRKPQQKTTFTEDRTTPSYRPVLLRLGLDILWVSLERGPPQIVAISA